MQTYQSSLLCSSTTNSFLLLFLQSRFHYGPVISVAFNTEFLLVGQGPLLKVYRFATGELIDTRQVFRRNKIHGFSIGKDV